MRDAGVTVAAALTPQRTVEFHKAVLDSGVDLFVIQGTIVSAEHVAQRSEPLNLKQFIADLDVPVIVGGCATYQAALHLMRTGAAGILVGVGPGVACTTRGVLGIGVPMATSVADVAGGPARLPRRVRRPVRARHRRRRDAHRRRHRQGGRLRGRRGHARLAARPRRRGPRPGLALGHRGPPRRRCPAGRGCGSAPSARLEEVLLGPGRTADGSTNLVGALRRAMATTGYSTLKEFQRVELMVAPAVVSEGKALQHAQGVGMGTGQA